MIHAEIGTYSAHGVVFSSFASRRNSVDALFSICVRVLIGVYIGECYSNTRTHYVPKQAHSQISHSQRPFRYISHVLSSHFLSKMFSNNSALLDLSSRHPRILVLWYTKVVLYQNVVRSQTVLSSIVPGRTCVRASCLVSRVCRSMASCVGLWRSLEKVKALD